MTVAAVILFRELEGALADTAGRPAVRRIVETAWAGGATPIVVVSSDKGGQVAAALAGSPAVLAEPAPSQTGPVGQISQGIRVAARQVTETDAALIWPGRMAWVDAETVTTLIEAHGGARQTMLRAAYRGEAGWPVLLPLDRLAQLAELSAERMPDELIDDLIAAGVPARLIETGDPGVTHDVGVALDQLPDYEAPPEPAGGPAPEWGAAAAEMPDEGPLQGPALAPYSQATDEGD